MTTKPKSLPEALTRHLSANNTTTSLSDYLAQGAELVTPEAIEALRQQQEPLRAKIASLADSERLRSRIELLAAIFEETCTEGHTGSQAHRAIAFALLYFLKGADRIPDSVPEIGFVDDAMVIQIVLQHHAATIRAYCQRHNHPCPAELE